MLMQSCCWRGRMPRRVFLFFLLFAQLGSQHKNPAVTFVLTFGQIFLFHSRPIICLSRQEEIFVEKVDRGMLPARSRLGRLSLLACCDVHR